MQDKSHLFIIYSMRLAGQLMAQGYKLVAVEPDHKNPEHFVYWFPQSPELEKIVAEYQASRHKN